jgi:DNA mismatch repair protein MutL
MKPKNIEVRFIKMGSEGFDVIDNGIGIAECEFESLCKTLPIRERNDLYKTRSLGYQGEALQSLCKSSEVTIITKPPNSAVGYELAYDSEGELVSKTKINMPVQGTTIEIRRIHYANDRMSISYKNH